MRLQAKRDAAATAAAAAFSAMLALFAAGAVRGIAQTPVAPPPPAAPAPGPIAPPAAPAAAPAAAAAAAPPAARPLTAAGAPRYMRRLARQLRALVKGTPVEVATARTDVLTLRIPADYLFGLDATQLSPAAPGRLDPLVKTLAAADRTVLVVAGHTDTLGTREFNAAFSLRRAAAVADYLQMQGIAAPRVGARGAGELELVEKKEDSPAARRRNRRIEIEVRPFRPSRREAS